MTYSGPVIADITRTQGDRDPPETFTWPGDLTGHTAHLVIVSSTGAAIDTIEGDVTAGATSTIEFPITSAAVASAFVGSYSVIFDKDSPALKSTRQAGDWIVVDYAG